MRDVATEFGFLELGRFANHYASMFGEYPTQTLHRMRSPADRALRANPEASDARAVPCDDAVRRVDGHLVISPVYDRRMSDATLRPRYDP